MPIDTLTRFVNELVREHNDIYIVNYNSSCKIKFRSNSGITVEIDYYGDKFEFIINITGKIFSSDCEARIVTRIPDHKQAKKWLLKTVKHFGSVLLAGEI